MSLYHPAIRPLRILLVEDTASDALLTQKSLDACDIPYKLTTLRRGMDLLPHVSEYGRPDIILLDFGLPDMDGFEVLAELAQQPPTIRAIPIVIVTGYQNFEYVRHIYPLHIVGYLNKPCTPEDMQALLACT